MEIIPLIKLHKKDVIQKHRELVDNLDDNQLIYILDLDGLEKNKPDLCVYQRLAKNHEIWVDNGLQTLGDVVDAFMAGAVAITIRQELYHDINIDKVREISENNVFANIEVDQDNVFGKDLFYDKFDGFVNFNKKEEIDQDFKTRDLIKQFAFKNKTYSYEDNLYNISYWKTLGIQKILVDISKYEEFKNHGI